VLMLISPVENASPAPQEDVPEASPILVVVVDQQGRRRVGPDIAHPAQPVRRDRLRLGVDGVIQGFAEQHETDRHHRWAAAIRGREVANTCRSDPSPPNAVDQLDADIIR
jgi:hypothetical protein